MKKYKVTDKHPAYKEGLIIKDRDSHIYDYVLYSINGKEWNNIPIANIDKWINNGWIKEIQEPEFTKDDMVDFGNWCYSSYPYRFATSKINNHDVLRWKAEKEQAP